MADRTINSLDPLSVELTDELEMQRTNNGIAGKITVQGIVDQVPPSTTAVWGQITGTLSNQTDLQAALNAKTDVTAFNAHTGDSSIHYTQASISITESQISDLGVYATQASLDAHTGTASIHFADAPADGSQYARRNNAWEVVAGGGSGTYNQTTKDGVGVSVNRSILEFRDTGDATVTVTDDAGGDRTIISIDATAGGGGGGVQAGTPFVVGDLLQVESAAGDGTIQTTGVAVSSLATQVALDSHTGDSSIHYTQASISITESQISDFGSYLTTTGGTLTGGLTVNSSGVADSPLVLNQSAGQVVPSIAVTSSGGSAGDIFSVLADGTVTPAGPVRIADGSVTVPSLALSADTNTGFYRVGADVIGVAINGTLIATFSAAGIRTTQDLQAFQTLP